MKTKKIGIKQVLAGLGVVYLVLFVGYLAYMGLKNTRPSGPSELEAHPERQDEILARQRAEEMRDRLGLSEEQTQQIAQLLQSMGDPGQGGFRGRREAMREELAKILTPEQLAKLESAPGFGPGGGGPRGPGGPGGGPPGMGGGRMEEVRSKMTPDQQARLDARLQDMRDKRGPRGGGQRQPGGQGQ